MGFQQASNCCPLAAHGCPLPGPQPDSKAQIRECSVCTPKRGPLRLHSPGNCVFLSLIPGHSLGPTGPHRPSGSIALGQVQGPLTWPSHLEGGPWQRPMWASRASAELWLTGTCRGSKDFESPGQRCQERHGHLTPGGPVTLSVPGCWLLAAG